ncbi:MAG TPA: glycoside hydrolase family 2 [Verrucomicrobiae bacterium]
MLNSTAYPRPEYPRPDFQRGTIEGFDWLNLNGPWQFRFDANRVGEAEEWFRPDDIPWREQIIVPFCWESLAAWGEADSAGNENYYATRVYLNPLEVSKENHRFAPRYEVGWYRRWVKIPKSEAWEGKRAILTVGAADYFLDCWCNGKHFGRQEAGYLPAEFDITDALETLEDGSLYGCVVFRVEDPMENNEQPVGKQWRWYTTCSGIWQTVYVAPRGASYLDCWSVVTDIEKSTADFRIETKNAPPRSSVEIEITPPQGARQIVTIPLQGEIAQRRLEIAPLFLWNPNEPHLYRVKFRLKRGGQVLDYVQTYFGMRKVASAPSEDPNQPETLCLNNVTRYHRGVLHQAYYPEGVYTPRDVERFKTDIAFAKQAGFNFLRVHIKIEDPLFLYYADTIGILLMCDFPNFGEGGDTPLGRKRYEAMMRAAIKRDFNHPSIFAWCLFNETWGFGGQVEFVKLFSKDPRDKGSGSAAGVSALATEVPEKNAKDAAEAALTRVKLSNASSHVFVQTMWELAKKLDTTRLIEDMSVVHWEHLDYFAHGDTDINSWHFYLHDYYKAKEHIEKVVRSTYTGSSFNYVDGYKQRSQPLINSEYGGIGALDGNRDISWSFKFLTNELRRHGSISGYIFTELHDVEWEYNGFMNYDRTPKEFGYDPRIINESDMLPINAAPIQRCEHGQRLTIEVSSSHFSSKRHENVVLQWRLSGIDTQGKYRQDLARGSAPIPFPHKKVAPAHAIELELPRETMICTLDVEAFQAENGEVVAQNFVQFFVTNGYPPPREDLPRYTILRLQPADWARQHWSGYAGDRDKERAEDAAWGFGNGFFEYDLPIHGIDLTKAYRIRVLCEASSRRIDTPQTDANPFPTTLQMSLNDVRVFEETLPNHPHDARGVLSYLRGGAGAYGYMAHATIERELLRQVAERAREHLVLRLAVPTTSLTQNGLQIYGAENGRFPVCPTVVIEW